MVTAGYIHTNSRADPKDIVGFPGAKVKVEKADNAFGSIAYMFSDDVAGEFVLVAPYHRDVYGAGTLASVGKIGSTDVLSSALAMSYRFFDSKAAFRPYVKLAMVNTVFRHAKGSATLTALTNPGGATTTVSVDNKRGVVPKVGFVYALNDRLFIDGELYPVANKTIIHLSTGQTVNVNERAAGAGLALGLSF